MKYSQLSDKHNWTNFPDPFFMVVMWRLPSFLRNAYRTRKLLQ